MYKEIYKKMNESPFKIQLHNTKLDNMHFYSKTVKMIKTYTKIYINKISLEI